MQLPQTVEVKEIRVLTSKQIAEEYGTTPGVIKRISLIIENALLKENITYHLQVMS